MPMSNGSFRIGLTLLSLEMRWFVVNIDQNTELDTSHLIFANILHISCQHTRRRRIKAKLIQADPIKRLEINLVHSSVSNKIILPIGTKWCSKCRIWLHKETMRCHENIVDDSICFLCCATDLHTPKRKRLCDEDEPLPSTSWTPCS